MKKYSKLKVSSLVIDDVNEPVYLIGSSWYSSGCYRAVAEQDQKLGVGYHQITFQIDAAHGAGTFPGTTAHACTHQLVIINFAKALPEELIWVDTAVGTHFEIEPTQRKKVRFETSYWNNKEDNQGYGDFTLYFDLPDSIASLSIDDQNAWIAQNIVPVSDINKTVEIYDTWWRV